jgi:copper chaperone NosL
LPLSSCTKKPQPIAYGKDGCSFCKMTIMDNRFACEIISKTGKAYKFDDLQCMHQAIKSGLVEQEQVYGEYVTTFTADHQFVDANKSFMLASKDLNSPMGGNIATFANEDSFKHYLKEMNGTATTWKEINQ